LVENLHRQDLNPLEEAAAYQRLIEEFDHTQEQVAQRVGRSRSAVANLLRLFQLTPAVQKLVGEGLLSAGHAKALLAHPDRAYQESLAMRSVRESLSVRQVEELVKERLALESRLEDEAPAGPSPTSPVGNEPSPPGGKLRPPGLLELEELLADHLDTRVAISMSAKRGRVTIEFADLEDLERIYRRIIGG
jgi:ParB family chromosome partitioning protein